LRTRRSQGFLFLTFVAGCAARIVLVGPSLVFPGGHGTSDVAGGYVIGGLGLAGLIGAHCGVAQRLV